MNFDELCVKEKMNYLFCEQCGVFYEIRTKCFNCDGVQRGVGEDLKGVNGIYDDIIGG